MNPRKWRIFKIGPKWHVSCPHCDMFICCVGATPIEETGFSNYWWATMGAHLHYNTRHCTQDG